MHLEPDPALIDGSDNNHVVIEFMAMAKTPEGKPVDPPTGKKVDAHLTQDKLAAVQQLGLAYAGALELAPGEYTVRFVVRDDLSGRIGSVAAPLKVE